MAELSTTPRVFTFPASLPFIDALARHVLESGAAHPSTLLFLPSRRAATAFRDAALRLSDGKPLLLPRIFPLGDMDESEWFFDVPEGVETDSVPPAISRTRRHVLLTKLVAQHLDQVSAAPKANMEEAALLALELAKLLDEVEREEISLDKLRELAPGELARHWEQTLSFMQIISKRWPQELAALKLTGPAERRSRMLRALAAHWERQPPPARIIAAGSTGSQPATAALLKVIAHLPQGEVILPALDVDMPQEAWRAVDEVHPQYQLKRLLEHLEMSRAEVDVQGAVADEAGQARVDFLRAALLPASFTHAWGGLALPVEKALQGFHRVEAPNLYEEARTIALLLRETVEVPGKRAALVTHERTLARMVAAEMQRFGITVDDSAGRGIATLPVTVFLRLTAEMCLSRAAPVALLAVLKHPLAAAGMETPECRQAARGLETALLRGVRSSKGFAAMRQALAAQEDAPADAMRLLAALEKTAGEFIAAFGKKSHSFAAMLELHLACAESLAATPEENGAARLWAGEEGAAVAEALAEIGDHARELPPIDPQNYIALLDVLLSGYTYRPAYGQHARLAILSPIEARLQHFDRVILGGLNEGSWPPAAQASPWMSRPMQQEFGLPAPERQVGMAAHDFMTLACAGEVILSRALKSGGALTSPSRWLRRIDTMLMAARKAEFHWPPLPQQLWARELNAPEVMQLRAPPRPCPPVSARPRRFSVSDIDRWLRDPYALYAQKILGLTPLEPLDKQPGAQEFGTLLHRTIELFTKACPGELPPDAKYVWMECAGKAFRAFEDRPAVRAFWWRRIGRIADWMLAQEAQRRPLMVQLQAEVKGERVYDTPAGEITLKARIDRVEQRRTGAAVIADYKTGASPSRSKVKDALAVQLPLGASITGGKVEALEYWTLSGRNYAVQSVAENVSEVERAVAAAEARLRELAVAYGDREMPYLVQPLPHLFGPAFNDYEHLERAEEWEA